MSGAVLEQMVHDDKRKRMGVGGPSATPPPPRTRRTSRQRPTGSNIWQAAAARSHQEEQQFHLSHIYTKNRPKQHKRKPSVGCTRMLIEKRLDPNVIRRPLSNQRKMFFQTKKWKIC